MSRANVAGATRDRPDTILFGGRGIWRVSASGGRLEPIVSNVNGVARTTSEIALIPLHSDARAVPLLRSKAAYRNPEVSPDRKWVAYQTNASRRFEIEVRPYPDLESGRYPGSERPATRRVAAVTVRITG